MFARNIRKFNQTRKRTKPSGLNPHIQRKRDRERERSTSDEKHTFLFSTFRDDDTKWIVDKIKAYCDTKLGKLYSLNSARVSCPGADLAGRINKAWHSMGGSSEHVFYDYDRLRKSRSVDTASHQHTYITEFTCNFTLLCIKASYAHYCV